MVEDVEKIEREGEGIISIVKRRKVRDSETQTTPKKLSLLEIDMEDSPMTKHWIEKAQKAEIMLNKAMEFVALKRRSKNLLKELQMNQFI
jgi:hypothetical protein